VGHGAWEDRVRPPCSGLAGPASVAKQTTVIGSRRLQRSESLRDWTGGSERSSLVGEPMHWPCAEEGAESCAAPALLSALHASMCEVVERDLKTPTEAQQARSLSRDRTRGRTPTLRRLMRNVERAQVHWAVHLRVRTEFQKQRSSGSETENKREGRCSAAPDTPRTQKRGMHCEKIRATTMA